MTESPSQKKAPTSAQQTPIAAPLWRRFAAMLYDFLVILAVIMAYGAILIWIKYSLLETPLAIGERASIGIAGFIGMLAVVTAFFSFFWHRSGQTLGMKAWRLQIRSQDGELPSYAQGTIRCLLAGLSLACLAIGHFYCLFSKNRQTLHDNLSGTSTWVLPKHQP